MGSAESKMGSRDIFTQKEGMPRSWCRDGFFCSTDKQFLDPVAVNEVFKSDLMWWNDPLEISQMRRMLDNCLTLCVFAVPDTEAEMKGKQNASTFTMKQNTNFLYR